MISFRLRSQCDELHCVDLDDGGARCLSVDKLVVGLFCILSKSKIGARLNNLSLSLLLQSRETQLPSDCDVEGASSVVFSIDTLLRLQ